MSKRPRPYSNVPLWRYVTEGGSSRLLNLGEIPADGLPIPDGKPRTEAPFATQCHRCFAETGERGTCEKCLNEMRERAELEMEVAVRKP